MIPNIQKKRILEYLKEGKRFDGRELLQFRDIKIERGISKNSEGSCSVKIGNTEVYAGVKMSISEPYPDSPDEGSLSVNVELGPLADEEFEIGPPKIDAIEMARVVDRGIRESGFIDFKKLCIKEGEKCWQINVDIYAINNDGNLLDAASLAALVSLISAKMPKYNEEEEKIEKEFTNKSLPLKKENMPITITFYKLGKDFIVDANRDEEEISNYRLSIAISDGKEGPIINAMQKGKEGGIAFEELEKVLNILEDLYSEFYKKIKKEILEDGK
ncbi:MAG: exosome complex protein Rrp42 [Candidatus Pacearchaeota archaeon]